MNTFSHLIRPSGNFCFGRDAFCSEIIKVAFHHRALLLFGGRQSGKTTILLRIKELLGKNQGISTELNSIDIPVYIDLMTMPYDATPNDFWYFIAKQAQRACKHQIEGFESEGISESLTRLNFDQFVIYISSLFQKGGEVEFRLLFLLDEAKRVLGKRFPRGFLDNIFSLLYGGDLSLGNNFGMIFSGAQDLYALSEDDTSPIASRAGSRVVPMLNEKSIIEMTNFFSDNSLGDEITENAGKWVHSWTGGHAGISVRFAQKLFDGHYDQKVLNNNYAHIISDENKNLLRVWARSLSAEARQIQELLLIHGETEIRSIAIRFKETGFDYLNTDKAIEEMCFMGLIKDKEKNVYPLKKAYWNYSKEYANSNNKYGTSVERSVWNLIDEV